MSAPKHTADHAFPVRLASFLLGLLAVGAVVDAAIEAGGARWTLAAWDLIAGGLCGAYFANRLWRAASFLKAERGAGR